ncbi:MAG: hypothetical protein U0Y82_15130 [Thermoleophilia bacterium]
MAEPDDDDERGWAHEQLDRLRALTDDEDLDAYLAGVEPRGAREQEMLTELASHQPVLAMPDQFLPAHHRVMRALESVRRHGARRPVLQGPPVWTHVSRYLIELVARYVLVSFVQQVATDLRNLYRVREAQSPLRTREHMVLRRARRDAEDLRQVFQGRTIGVPTFLVGGALIPVLASMANVVTAVNPNITDPRFLVTVVIGLLVTAFISWVVLRGAALAHRRIQIATRVPLERLWQTIGTAGKPPRDDGSTLATLAIVVTAVAWLVFPAIILLAAVH